MVDMPQNTDKPGISISKWSEDDDEVDQGSIKINTYLGRGR